SDCGVRRGRSTYEAQPVVVESIWGGELEEEEIDRLCVLGQKVYHTELGDGGICSQEDDGHYSISFSSKIFEGQSFERILDRNDFFIYVASPKSKKHRVGAGRSFASE